MTRRQREQRRQREERARQRQENSSQAPSDVEYDPQLDCPADPRDFGIRSLAEAMLSQHIDKTYLYDRVSMPKQKVKPHLRGACLRLSRQGVKVLRAKG